MNICACVYLYIHIHTYVHMYIYVHMCIYALHIYNNELIFLCKHETFLDLRYLQRKTF